MTGHFSAIEFFCGIGGCAAAIGERVRLVAAVDIDQAAATVYRANFPAQECEIREIESLPTAWFAERAADLWWWSPPCQPYTVKGKRRDLDDPRAASLVALANRLEEHRPRYLVLENVPPFARSRARDLLVRTLAAAGYSFAEHLLCPTQYGWPMLRQRYYLAASRSLPLRPLTLPPRRCVKLRELLDPAPDAALDLPPDVLARWQSALAVVDPADDTTAAACFGSGYGRSWVGCGSCLKTPRGLRMFSPAEILRLLEFPLNYVWPAELPLRKSWSLLGNSLSVSAARCVLGTIDELSVLVPASSPPGLH